jgi:hypothetical protein
MPKVQHEIENLLAEARALSASRVITTNEGRALVNIFVRLVEVLGEGKATTTLQTRHHP